MGLTIEKIVEVMKSFQDSLPPERIVVVGYKAYIQLGAHFTVKHYSPELGFVHTLQGMECHLTFVIPAMNYMLLSREEFEKFKEDEAEFLNQDKSCQ